MYTRRAAVGVTFSLVILALVICPVSALRCLKGTAPLVSATDRDWCNGVTADGCSLDFSFSFDDTAPSSARWALKAFVGAGSNRTALRTMFPTLIDVGFQCSTNGDVIATTRTGLNNERLRFIWRYVGANSFSCANIFENLDMAADFSQFSAMLSYSGRVSSFDATFTSTSAAFSIARLDSVANCEAASNPPPSTTTTTASTSSPASSCIVSDCRHSYITWTGKSMRKLVVWKSLGAKTLCGLSYREIMLSNSGDVKQMGVNWLADARELITCEFNAARSGCPLPVDSVENLSALYSYLSNPLNCVQNSYHADWLVSIRAWNDQESVCKLMQQHANANDDGSTPVRANHSSKQQKAILIVMIIALVLLFILCIAMLLLIACMYRPIRRRVGGYVRRMCCSCAGVSIEEQEALYNESPDRNKLVPDPRLVLTERTSAGGDTVVVSANTPLIYVDPSQQPPPSQTMQLQSRITHAHQIRLANEIASTVQHFPTLEPGTQTTLAPISAARFVQPGAGTRGLH